MSNTTSYPTIVSKWSPSTRRIAIREYKATWLVRLFLETKEAVASFHHRTTTVTTLPSGQVKNDYFTMKKSLSTWRTFTGSYENDFLAARFAHLKSNRCRSPGSSCPGRAVRCRAPISRLRTLPTGRLSSSGFPRPSKPTRGPRQERTFDTGSSWCGRCRQIFWNWCVFKQSSVLIWTPLSFVCRQILFDQLPSEVLRECQTPNAERQTPKLETPFFAQKLFKADARAAGKRTQFW